ncbi:hypothetical protein CL635_01025 [bacterium]|jgi:hypothetical protein|nr:hypothetical protein [bacterium]|tara:strand:+ start:9955 stop:10872 length:918 start_codon:yes stop_codon:yes gene_type:complete
MVPEQPIEDDNPRTTKSGENSLPIVDGENGIMSRVYGVVGAEGHSCKSCVSNAEYNGGDPSCHNSAVGEYDAAGNLDREGCGYVCCKIEPDTSKGAGNSIILEIGELDSLKNQGHLTVIGQHKGVPLVQCTTGRCDGEVDVKPLDCKRYPFLPIIEGDTLRFQHGVRSKCPMPEIDRILHLAYVITSVLKSLKLNPASRNTFQHGHEEMVGYEDFDVGFLANKGLDEIEQESDIEIAAQIERERVRIELFAPPELDKQELLDKYEEHLVAMKRMNLLNFRVLKEAGVVFTEEGIDLKAVNFDLIS